LPLLRHEELARVEPLRIQPRGSGDVSLRLAERRRPTVGEHPQQRLQKPSTERPRNQAVAGQYLLPTVALVAPEDLVAPIPGEQHLDPRLPGQPGTEIRGNRRVVP